MFLPARANIPGRLLLSVMLICLVSGAFGQGSSMQLSQQGYYIKQYTELDGLVNNRCKYIFEDSRGFVWISTFQGLSRFDGKRFLNFGLKEGLPSINISQVCEDANGYIYVATAKGIARYTGRRGVNGIYFQVYKETTQLSSAISGMQAIDSSSFVFQRIGGGLYHYQKGQLHTLLAGPINYEMSVFRDNENTFYAYAQDTFHIYNAALHPLRKVFFPNARYMTFYYDNNRNLLHASASGKLYQLNKEGLQFMGAVPDSIAWLWVNNKPASFFYSASRKDLCLRNNGTDIRVIDFSKQSLYINDLRRTRDGSVWITTSAGGIFRLSALPYSVFETGNIQYLRSQQYRNVIVTGGSKDPALEAAFTRLKDKTINAVLLEKGNTGWFCTSSGIYSVQPGKPLSSYIFTGNEQLYGKSSLEIRGAVEGEGPGDMWFYGYAGLIHAGNSGFRQYKKEKILGDDELIRQCVMQKDGTVLLADWYYLLQLKGDSLVRAAIEPALFNYVPNRLVADKDGFAWIDYNKKLFKLQKQVSGNFRMVDSIIPYDLLPTAAEISTFEFDNSNNCWIGYNGGSLKVFFRDDEGHYNVKNSAAYTVDDGLASLTGTDYRLIPDANGNMVIVPRKQGNDKVYVFSVADALERKNAAPVQVSITGLLLNQQVPDWEARGNRLNPEGLPDHPDIAFNNNDITINYSGVSLVNPDEIVYQIMLRGYSKDWITTTLSSATYFNLPPGEYRFQVRASNVNGTWGSPVQYDFRILPPWYKTWWAWTIWITLGISMALLLLNLRVRMLRKSVTLEHLKKTNQFKNVLISLLGHDINTPLQFIGKVAGHLKSSAAKADKQTVTEGLDAIHHTSFQLQLYGESIIHWIKVQNNELSAGLKKQFAVAPMLDELAAFHSLMASEKGNVIVNKTDPGLTIFQDPLLLRVILHNLLLNANKFTSQGIITMDATRQNETVLLSVTDTGKGMNADKVEALNNFKPVDSKPGTNNEKGWGLGFTIVMDMLKFTGGTMHVESGLNEGTGISISLPAV